MPKTRRPSRPTAGKPLTLRFGGLVQAHRRRRGMTQEELAEKAGVSKDLIAKVETGLTGARYQNIQAIADALSVDAAELFTGELPNGSLMRPEMAELFVTLAKLSEADFAWVKGVIEAALRNK